jgi:putative addiction module component (TIGR02574 family)
MTSATLERIEREALALPVKERAQLVDKLWESLGDTTCLVLNEEWNAELERRRRNLIEGKARVVPGEEVSRKAREIVNSPRR